MRLKYWLYGTLLFSLGILVGVFGYLALSNALNPGVTQPEGKVNATKVDALTSPGLILPETEQGAGESSLGPVKDALTDPANRDEASGLSEGEEEKIIADYKQGLGILFDAWKSKDMVDFRLAIGRAYTGELLEKHLQKAKQYIPQGVGIEVTEIIFDHVALDSANEVAATVDAIYRYSVRDYDLDERFPIGEKSDHFVHVRANLIKVEDRWMITGETSL